MMKQWEHIIFDVDGVLLDSMPIWEHSASLYLKQVWNIDAEPSIDRDCATLSLLEAANYIKQLYPQIDVTDRTLADGVAAFIRERYWQAEARPGMQETIHTLKEQGYHLYLATASETENVRGALLNLGVWNCFDAIYTCTDIGYSKSYTEYYEKVAQCIGVQCKDLIMVEDSIHSMVTAKKAGLTVAAVYEPYSAADAAAIRNVSDVYVDALPQIIPYITDHLTLAQRK